MDKNDQDWILIMDHRSQFFKTTGAYQLNTLMKCREMNILPKFKHK